MKKHWGKKCILAAALLALVLTACGGKSVSQEDKGGGGETKNMREQVSVYYAYAEDEAQLLFDAFEKATGIKVQGVRLSAGELLARIEAEGDNTQASVVITGRQTLNVAGEEGLLQPYESKALDEIGEEFRSPDNMWTAHTFGSVCYLSNTNVLKELNMSTPDSWYSVLDLAYKDQVILAHPATSGMSYTWMSIAIQIMGEDKAFEYMKELDQNVFQYAKSSIACPRTVGLGEAAVTFCDVSDAVKAQKTGYPVEISFPKEGVGYDMTVMALTKNGPEKELETAKKFIDWMAGKEAQELFVEKTYRWPVNTKAEIPTDIPQISDLTLVKMDYDYYISNRDTLLDRFDKEIKSKDNVVE